MGEGGGDCQIKLLRFADSELVKRERGQERETECKGRDRFSRAEKLQWFAAGILMSGRLQQRS